MGLVSCGEEAGLVQTWLCQWLPPGIEHILPTPPGLHPTQLCCILYSYMGR